MLRALLISVELHGQVLVAVAELVDGEIVVTPASKKYESSAQTVREQPVIDGTGPPISIKEPERWLRALPWMYHGSRFYAYLDESGTETKLTLDGVMMGYIDLNKGQLICVDSELKELVSGLEERGDGLGKALEEMGYKL